MEDKEVYVLKYSGKGIEVMEKDIFERTRALNRCKAYLANAKRWVNSPITVCSKG